MDGTIDFIVLEHDDVAGCALIAGAVDGVVPALDGYNTPYVVAMGYDHPTRNWEDCTLFDDIVKANISPYLRQIAQRCQRISHPIDPPETAAAAARATFGGAAARPAYRGHKNQ